MRYPHRRLIGLLGLVLLPLSPAIGHAQSLPPETEPSPAAGPSTRLIFGPTARMPEPNHGHLIGFEAYNFVVVQGGVTKRFALSAGTFTMTALCGCSPTLIVAPKFQLMERGRTAVAAGVAHVWGMGNGHHGYAYAVTTYGSADNAITAGLGLLYGRDASPRRLISFGAERRLGPRGVWVTENYFTRDGVMTSGGFRVHGTHWSVDLALGWLIADGRIVPLPVVNIGRSF
jgi:hypothetical protein